LSRAERALVLRHQPSARQLAVLESLESAAGYAREARSERTRERYRDAWAIFAGWCKKQELKPLPAEPATVAAYLAARADAGRKVTTIELELTAIGEAHKAAGLPSPRTHPVVVATRKGIRRRLGMAPSQKDALTTGQLRAMVTALPARLLGSRDRALLLLGFAGAFRRSELVGLDVRDLDFCPEGLRVTLRRSKTDQEGKGRVIGIPASADPAMCPVAAIRAWVAAASVIGGPLFREVSSSGRVGQARLGSRVVGTVVKRAAVVVGLDPRNLAGHSLRAGYATEAARAGKPIFVIQQQTGHRSVAMVSRYVRAVDLFRDVRVL
jgi:site-specific recombinase XerD